MKCDVILADTTVWVHFLRGDNLAAKDRLTPLILEDRLCTADIIIMEILRGARSDKGYEALYNDLTVLPRLPMEGAVWERAWKTGCLLKKKGINAPLADILIASLAVEHSCLLLHDDRHFSLMSKAVDLKEEVLTG
jgi:predicted nucleic acid-binding protein